ncbi:Clp protease ClpE, partial [Escherichia coli]|nr:Clp protease ClpE [Escherichia coli]
GSLQTWTINQKKAAAPSGQKASDSPVNPSDKADKK